MPESLKLVLCGVAAISLGGCQSFLADIGIAKRGNTEGSAAISDAASRVALGQAALRAGAPGNAIFHFERAILDPQEAPDAYNGMGVAYAQLGREDLARRFFNAALMLRPDDSRISRNLARLYTQESTARNARAASAEPTGDKYTASSDFLATRQTDADQSRVYGRDTIRIDLRRAPTNRSSADEVLIGEAESTISFNSKTPPPAAVPNKPRQATQIKGENTEVQSKQYIGSSGDPEGNLAGLTFNQEFCQSGDKSGQPKPQGYPIRVSLNDGSD